MSWWDRACPEGAAVLAVWHRGGTEVSQSWGADPQQHRASLCPAAAAAVLAVWHRGGTEVAQGFHRGFTELGADPQQHRPVSALQQQQCWRTVPASRAGARWDARALPPY